MFFTNPFVIGDRKKRGRMSKLSQIKALCLDLGYPKAYKGTSSGEVCL